MSDEIVFYHNPQSRAQMAHWMLEEAGAPYKTVLIDFAKGENRTPEFLAINPMGKLPTIVHRGVVVTETAAIIAYVADAFPASGLAPPVERKSAVGWGSYEEVVAALKTALAQGPYLLGERFTAADVYVGSELRWAMMFGAPGLKGEKVLDDYVARLSARPAAKRSSGG